MPQVFLTPKWLLRHLLAVVLVAVCLRLGWWQLDEALATGDPQNIGYALEWPAFAVAVVFVWRRLVQWELNPPKKAPRLTAPLHADPRPTPPAAEAAPVPADPGTDDAHDRYNRYLADLARRAEDGTR